MSSETHETFNIIAYLLLPAIALVTLLWIIATIGGSTSFMQPAQTSDVAVLVDFALSSPDDVLFQYHPFLDSYLFSIEEEKLEVVDTETNLGTLANIHVPGYINLRTDFTSDTMTQILIHKSANSVDISGLSSITFLNTPTRIRERICPTSSTVYDFTLTAKPAKQSVIAGLQQEIIHSGGEPIVVQLDEANIESSTVIVQTSNVDVGCFVANALQRVNPNVYILLLTDESLGLTDDVTILVSPNYVFFSDISKALNQASGVVER